MQEKVMEYISARKMEQEKKKEQHLIDLGLWEKEYGADTLKFTLYDLEQQKYYRKKAIQVTEEEYAEICACPVTEAYSSNGVSVVYKVFAWIVFIGGFIAGIVTGASASRYGGDFQFVLALPVWAGAFAGGMGLLAVAEIIGLLSKIHQKL